MLDMAKNNWTISILTSMYNNGKLSFDNIMQRSWVWELYRRSWLIHSVCENYPIPPVYARRWKDEKGKPTYDLLDGKQRLLSLITFALDQWAIEGIPPVQVSDDGEPVDINGKKFSELPKEIQNIISGYSLQVIYFDDMTDEQARVMFKKLNSGKPLSNKEMNIASCVDISNFTEMGKHPLFDIALTEKAKGSKKQIFLLEKMWAILNKPLDELSFEAKKFNDLVSSIESTEEERKVLSQILDKMYAVYNLFDDTVKPEKTAKKKMTCETHFVSLVPFFKKGIDEEISDEMMKGFVTSAFSSKSPVSDKYSASCRAGSAKTHNILTRNGELETAWNNFFATSEEEIVEVQKGNVVLDGEDEVETPVEEESEVTMEVIATDKTQEATPTTEEEHPEIIFHEEDVVPVFKYGMRIRGAAPGAQPDGMMSCDDGDGKYFSFIYYNRELTEEEIEHYSLDLIK